MSRPHRRCATCNVVTSRYSRTKMQGPFAVQVWVRDEGNGSEQGADGKYYCREHAPTGAEPFVFTPVPAMPPVTVDDLAAMAANDPSLDDDAFVALSRALRGDDPADTGGDL